MLQKLVPSSAIADHLILSSETNLLLITSRMIWRRKEFPPSRSSCSPSSLSLSHKWVIGRWKVFHLMTCLSRMPLWSQALTDILSWLTLSSKPENGF
jgi:hypothetical protein